MQLFFPTCCIDLSDFEKLEELTLFDIQIKDLRQQLLPLNDPTDFSKELVTNMICYFRRKIAFIF